MKLIHILQHVPYETPGCIENWINKKSYSCTVTELYRGDTLPLISEIDWLIVMGGPMSVHDTREFLWLIDEKKFIKEAVLAGKVVLGICLGSQLIAEVLGGKVYKNKVKEIGWFPITRINRELYSPFFSLFSNSETVFHWHGDTYDIPDETVSEFSSDGCLNQCFVYRGRVIGLQFHVEVTESLLESMIVNGVGEIVPAEYIQSSDQLRHSSNHIKRNNELMYSILNELDKV